MPLPAPALAPLAPLAPFWEPRGINLFWPLTTGWWYHAFWHGLLAEWPRMMTWLMTFFLMPNYATLVGPFCMMYLLSTIFIA